jgi:hypothetical protein
LKESSAADMKKPSQTEDAERWFQCRGADEQDAHIRRSSLALKHKERPTRM